MSETVAFFTGMGLGAIAAFPLGFVVGFVALFVWILYSVFLEGPRKRPGALRK